MDQSNDPERAAYLAQAAADYDSRAASLAVSTVAAAPAVPAIPEPAAGQTGADTAGPGPEVVAGAADPAVGSAPADPASAAAFIPHPVFGVLSKLEDELVARTTAEYLKLRDYIDSIRAHLSDLF